MLDFLHDKVISMKGSVLGFDELDKFRLQVLEQGSPYVYMQSEEDENIGFLAASPFTFFQEYQLELQDADKSALHIESHEEVAVLSLITMGETLQQATMNLLAPIIINVNEEIGKQIVLPPKFAYGTKEAMFRQAVAESGDSSC